MRDAAVTLVWTVQPPDVSAGGLKALREGLVDAGVVRVEITLAADALRVRVPTTAEALKARPVVEAWGGESGHALVWTGRE